jgi:hypothetical protein
MPDSLIGVRAVHFASTAMVFGVMLFRFQIAGAAFRQMGTAVGAKRTFAFALRVSAYDPKRTAGGPLPAR